MLPYGCWHLCEHMEAHEVAHPTQSAIDARCAAGFTKAVLYKRWLCKPTSRGCPTTPCPATERSQAMILALPCCMLFLLPVPAVASEEPTLMFLTFGAWCSLSCPWS